MIHWGELGMASGKTPIIKPQERNETFHPSSRLYVSLSHRLNNQSGQDSKQPGTSLAVLPTRQGVRRRSFTPFADTNTMADDRTQIQQKMIEPGALSVLDSWRKQTVTNGVEPKKSSTLLLSCDVNKASLNHEGGDSSAGEEVAIEDVDAFHQGVHRSTSLSDLPEIVSCNLLEQENAKAHHTLLFGCRENALTLRRGQAFCVDLEFSRAFDEEKHEVIVLFETGPAPRESNATRVQMLAGKEPTHKSDQWLAWLSAKDGTVKLNVQPSTKCVVGRWNFTVSTGVKARTENDSKMHRMILLRSSSYHEVIEIKYNTFEVDLLFNPWSEGDDTYMEDSQALEEYLLNDVGVIYRGTHNAPKQTGWVYGQHSASTLDNVLFILANSPLALAMRSSPVLVARAMAGMMNCANDNAILEGAWEEYYQGGMAPTEWTGSAAILDAFVKKGKAVKYGQCYTFAGVLTTILRTLGIPTRPVTAYCAAQDTETLHSVDRHVDADGRPIDKHNVDTVWNYHVFTEAWMRRPDLAAASTETSLDGWQALDPTPAEKADGLYLAGPAPVAAIKRGIACSYDVQALAATVNCDYSYWCIDGARTNRLRKDTEYIGQMIVTKAPGRQTSNMLFITDDYKRVLQPSHKSSFNPCCVPQKKEAEDVSFSVSIPNSFKLGRDLDVPIKIKNHCDKGNRTVHLSMRLEACFYTGQPTRKIKSERTRVELSSNLEATVNLNVTTSEYLKHATTQGCFLFSVVATISETGQCFTSTDCLRVNQPAIEMQVLESSTVGQDSSVSVQLHNPLPIALTDCRFRFEGSGIVDGVRIERRSHIAPGERDSFLLTVTPSLPGTRTLVGRFESNQMHDTEGVLVMDVRG